MTTVIKQAGVKLDIQPPELERLVLQALESFGGVKLRRVLLLPPDHTRLNSMAGPITAIAYRLLSGWGAKTDIMPALGTHAPMGVTELRLMFGDSIPLNCFLPHDWRKDVVSRGVIPGDKLREWSDGKVDYDVNIEVNKRLFSGYDLILSIGQVVPHEVVGMANYTKNVLVGVGGSETINKSHFLGAVCNMEKALGHADTPVRRLLNYGVSTFLSGLPIQYILTVMERDHAVGRMKMRGFYAGGGDESFREACQLCRKVNITLLDEPLKKVVVWLDPEEFRSTWLGNKAIYRTRMAIADEGELIVLAPGLKEFGEDKEIDRLVRHYGYKGTPHTLRCVAEHSELRNNLSAAAHLIHGSSEGRFSITYCPGHLTRTEIESVGYRYGDLKSLMARYNPEKLLDGMNDVGGEKVFFISNPALGLWSCRGNFSDRE
ncbi:MAG: lactate racemase domain-containing protein [bacterium]